LIEKYQLDNGVRIVLEPIPSVRSVAIGIWVGTGSRNEDGKNNGISHFIEHMLFKGTHSRTAKEIAQTFDRIGGQVNAYTSKEYTCYYAKVLDKHIDVAIDVLSDMYFDSLLDEEEIKKEKKVVIEEISMYEDAPDDLVHDLVISSAYGSHPLGFSILGTEPILQSLTREDLMRYMHETYTPENTVIAIAGNVDSSIIKKLSAKFSGYDRKLIIPNSGKPEYSGEPIIRTKKELEQTHLCIAMPGYPLGHDHLYSLIVLNNILGGTMSSRLFQEIREERGLAYSVFSYHSAFKDTGLTVLYAGTGSDQITDVIEITHQIIEDLKMNGITEQELNDCKEQLKGNLMLSLESTNSRMSRLGKNELMLGRHLNLDEMIQLIDQVSLESVYQVSQEILGKRVGTALVTPLEEIPVNLN
jgi:predicted Zn-dependent peptidase